MLKLVQKIFFKQKNDDAKKDALYFLALFSVFFPVFYFLLGSTGRALHLFAANASILALELLGIAASVVPNAQDGFPHLIGSVRGNAFDAQINDLCGGATELAVLFAIVLASRDKSVKTRLFGVVAGFIVFSLFNPLRIALTLNAVGSWAFPLLHDVLFRISLIIVITGFYATWYSTTPTK